VSPGPSPASACEPDRHRRFRFFYLFVFAAISTSGVGLATEDSVNVPGGTASVRRLLRLAPTGTQTAAGSPSGLKPRRWHRIEVRVDRPELVVRARKEYFFQ